MVYILTDAIQWQPSQDPIGWNSSITLLQTSLCGIWTYTGETWAKGTFFWPLTIDPYRNIYCVHWELYMEAGHAAKRVCIKNVVLLCHLVLA